MTEELRRRLAVLFKEHSVPIDIDQITTTALEPTKRRRVTGPVVAAASFALVTAIGLATLAIGIRPQNDAVSPTTPSTLTTETAPNTTMSPQPATTNVPSTTVPSTTEPIVYPTEPIVLMDSPLVVQETPRGPIPNFDTATLGTETPLIPLTSLTADELALWANEFPLQDGEPIIALGSVGELLAFRMPITTFDALRVCDWGVGTGSLAQQGGEPYPLGECAFDIEPRPDLTVLGPRRHGTGSTSGSPWVSQVFWSDLSSEVAVVALTSEADNVQLWQRPVGGVAVFVVDSATEPVMQLVAYDKDGNQLDERSYQPSSP